MWNFRRTIKQVDDIEKNYVTRARVDGLEKRLSSMISRREFVIAMKDLRGDKERMHQENLQATHDLRQEIQDMRKEQGEELRSVHERVDLILSK